MSPEWKNQIAIEREQLRRLLHVHRALLEKCRAVEPSIDETAALAAILHAFYNGVENILKRLATGVDGMVSRGADWHAELLESIARPNAKRPAVISMDLYLHLREYMNFRHVFRHAYSFELRWNKMKHLVLGCVETLDRLDTELERFILGIERSEETR